MLLHLKSKPWNLRRIKLRIRMSIVSLLDLHSFHLSCLGKQQQVCKMFSVQTTWSKVFAASGECVTTRTHPKHPLTPTTFSPSFRTQLLGKAEPSSQQCTSTTNVFCILTTDDAPTCSSVITGTSSRNPLFPVANKQQDETMEAERVECEAKRKGPSDTVPQQQQQQHLR